jgi:hypothetical protein
VIRAAIIALMMEAVQTPETMVNLYQSTWCYNPEDSHFNCDGYNSVIGHQKVYFINFEMSIK